jgi:hypothetical protein
MDAAVVVMDVVVNAMAMVMTVVMVKAVMVLVIAVVIAMVVALRLLLVIVVAVMVAMTMRADVKRAATTWIDAKVWRAMLAAMPIVCAAVIVMMFRKRCWGLVGEYMCVVTVVSDCDQSC